MNKKSFLRGFGTGVLFAAIILGISCFIRTSDSSVISRAKKLGMVFENSNEKVVLANTEPPEVSASPDADSSDKNTDGTDKNDNKSDSKATAAPTSTVASDKKDKADKSDQNSTSGKTDKKDQTGSSDKKDKSNDEKFEDEKKNAEKNIKAAAKKLTINDGDWAGKVSKELEKMGVIDDADEFSKYLDANGYSSVINSGTYDVSPDDSFHDIAEKITSRFK